jgi:conserved oligomeric Golgi complex subunit 2
MGANATESRLDCTRSIPRPDRELCFDPALFAGKTGELDVESFIAAIRVRAPLSLLRDDLRLLLDTVHEELVACVQSDFSTFVGLGPLIADADGLADVTAQPLAGLQKDIDGLVGSLNSDIETLSTTLEERRKLANRADSLRVLLRSNDLLHKCERLLKAYALMDKTSPDALRLVDRIAGECAQLSFTLSRAGNGSFVQSISVRVSAVRSSVQSNLEAWLRRALFPQNTKACAGPYDSDILSRVLGAYIVVGLASEAEDFFRREIVAPFCSSRIRMTTLLASAERKKSEPSGSEKPSRTSADNATIQVGTKSNRSGDGNKLVTNDVVDALAVTAADAFEIAEQVIIDFLGDKVMPIMSLCNSDERLRNRLDFMGNSVWPHISKAITTNLSAAFSPGNPNVFHQSVLSATRLYQCMEEALISDLQRNTLRQSSATKDLWRHWNLPVYFQLRFQEITSAYDRSLRLGPVPVDSSDTGTESLTAPGSNSANNVRALSRVDFVSTGFQLLRSDMYQVKATVAMIDALRRCWSDDVYLKPLSHRFLRLSFQLLARYVTWVRTGLAGEWSAVDATPAGAARVHADVMQLQQRLPAEFIRVLRRPETGISAELLNEVDSEFTAAITSPEPRVDSDPLPSRLTSLLPDLERHMSDALSRSCIENLQPLRGILATYRMSSKPSPATHSSFVPKVLLPLKSFLRDQRGRLAAQSCLKISTDVAEATTEKYCEMAIDLLNSNKKSEETLRRLNIGGAADASGEKRGTMTDKVSIQLYLDVAKFKDDIDAVGVSLDDVPSMARLWERVKRDEGSGAVDNASRPSSSLSDERPPDHLSEEFNDERGNSRIEASSFVPGVGSEAKSRISGQKRDESEQ